MTIGKILVGVDLSKPSRAAMRTALELRAQCDAKLKVVYVWAAPGFDQHHTMQNVARADSNSHLRRAYEDTGAQFRDFLEKSGVAEGGPIETVVEVGLPWRKICDIAAEEGHDMIVIGTHGRSGIARAVTGSVAEAVIRHADCPVVTVRSDGP